MALMNRASSAGSNAWTVVGGIGGNLTPTHGDHVSTRACNAARKTALM